MKFIYEYNAYGKNMALTKTVDTRSYRKLIQILVIIRWNRIVESKHN